MCWRRADWAQQRIERGLSSVLASLEPDPGGDRYGCGTPVHAWELCVGCVCLSPGALGSCLEWWSPDKGARAFCK